MKDELSLDAAKCNDMCHGFRLVKKEFVASKDAELYTLRHEKTGAELLYFDRADENKTFAIAFKTLPEDSTGVFHILEHSVLNGSRKFRVKEPFVSMLQSSMYTFLNAMTYNDKTVYPISSRNEQDFFNLMTVYLDAVFAPLIYERPEIFMQEGWHYEFESEDAEPYYNGVVFSEMKGAYADVDTVIEDETSRLLFPDNCYGYVSGGHPEHITELTYEQFLDTHRRFYHPTNAKIFLDGHMQIDRVLRYIDEEYLSKYDYREPDFDFVVQTSKTAENTVYYAVQEGEPAQAHMAIAKILCLHDDVEKIYAARVLADYLTGSNEAPLKRAFLEKNLAQDVNLEIGGEGAYQPDISLIVRNTAEENFAKIKKILPEAVDVLLRDGMDREALSASLERLAFTNREIVEPYGVELAIKALDGWLYGDDPLTHIDNAQIFENLRKKIDTGYFTELLEELLGDPADKSYLYVLPSATKDQEDAQKEAKRLAAVTVDWDAAERKKAYEAFAKMQEWQQSADSEELLTALPHLSLKDVPRETKPTESEQLLLSGTKVQKIMTNTNGIVYLNLFFDLSDFSVEELRKLNALTICFGELGTEYHSAEQLQNEIKAMLGNLYAKIELIAKAKDLKSCRPYLRVSASMLEENVPAAMQLIEEILLHTRYDETDRIYETFLQSDYFMKQSLIGSGHLYAIQKVLSAFSAEDALKEQLDGESYIRWFSKFMESFEKNASENCAVFCTLTEKTFAKNRLFAGFSGNLPEAELAELIGLLPENQVGCAAEYSLADQKNSTIEISGSVGFSAMGHNLYRLGYEFSGHCSVLASMMTYGYLWNMVRVQGGAYGTGMGIQKNGGIFCYSYRDPNLENSRAAYAGLADFLEEALAQGMSVEDMIIGTVNTTDPLLAPSGITLIECLRTLKGTTHESIAKIRHEILDTTAEDLKKLVEMLRLYQEKGKYCAVGDKNSVASVVKE